MPEFYGGNRSRYAADSGEKGYGMRSHTGGNVHDLAQAKTYHDRTDLLTEQCGSLAEASREVWTLAGLTPEPCLLGSLDEHIGLLDGLSACL